MEAARQLGVDQSTLSRLENAQATMSISVAERYAEVLKMDPWALFLGHSLEVIERGVEKGVLTSRDVAKKMTRLIGIAHASGGITDGQLQGFITSGQRLVEKALESTAEREAVDRSRQAGDLMGAVQ